MLLAGAVALGRLPLATRPYVELPRLAVHMQWPGASAELVETYLGAPIESAIQGVRGVRRVSSESSEGEVQLDVELEPDASIQLARLGLLERLELLRPDFPAGASGLSVSNAVPEGLDEEPLLDYTVYGPYTPGALEDIVERQVRPRISAVPGVAAVTARGGALVGVAVVYRPEQLRALGLTPAALDAALAGAREIRSLGVERAGASTRPVVLRDVPEAVERLGDLPVRGPSGRIFQLRELATIRREEDDQDNFFRVQGEPAVAMTVTRLPGSDALKTAALVRAAMGELQPRLPTGLRFRVMTDESTRLGEQLTDLGRRGVIALVAVLLVLALTLRAPRAMLLVVASAAVAIAGTVLGLYLLKIPANLLTLAGLSMGLGILVQDGLVVIDRFRTVPDTAAGRAEAGRRITPAVLGATLTTTVVLFPFLYLQGNARAAFTPFAVAFGLALGFSILTAVVMVPAIGRGHGMHEVRWPAFRRGYSRVVIRLLRWRRPMIVVVVLLLGWLGWVFAVKIPRTSFGSWWGQRSTLNASLTFPSGSDPTSLDRSMHELERVVVGRPGVDLVTAYGGRNGGYMTVVFDDDAARTALPLTLQEEVSLRASLIGGASVSVFGRGPGFSSGGTVGGGQSYRVKILGYSFRGVEQLALDLKERLERIPRVRAVDINAASFWFGQERARDVTLSPDRIALARYGLTARDLADGVGREVGGASGRRRVEIAGEQLWLSLKAAGARDRTLDELREAALPAPGGARVRVGDVASVSERDALSRISREDQQYLRIVRYEFRGPQKLADRTHEAFMRSLSVPPGYVVSDQVDGWEPDNSEQGLWLVFGVGLALVLLSVALVFDSVWAAWMVFLTLPVSLAGVVVAFWAAGASFTREAAVGVILVVGLAVHQAILLVDGVLARSRRPRAEGRAPRGIGRNAALVVAACRDRGGMITTVTLTTLASLLPLAIGTSTDDLFGAIALATVGGTVAGTIGAMLVLPLMLVGGRGRGNGEQGTGAPAAL